MEKGKLRDVANFLFIQYYEQSLYLMGNALRLYQAISSPGPCFLPYADTIKIFFDILKFFVYIHYWIFLSS